MFSLLSKENGTFTLYTNIDVFLLVDVTRGIHNFVITTLPVGMQDTLGLDKG